MSGRHVVLVCIYIYISPVARSLPAESTCRGGQTSDFHLVEGQTHGLRAVTYLLVRSWIGVTSICGLLTREIDGRRGEIVELFLLLFFPFSLFLSIHRGSLWHDVMGWVRWATAGNLIEQSRFICPPYASASISFAVSLRDRCLNN